jgi:ubiquinol-cytochrome c reductase iron-sulfur subunit
VSERSERTTITVPRPENQRAYRAAVVSFAVAIAGGVTAAVGYGTAHTGNVLGLGLTFALTGIGVGMIAWAKYLDLDEHAVQERDRLDTTPEEQAHLREEIELTKRTVGRRKLLLVLLGGSFVSTLVGFFGPVGSLGPRPRGGRGRTSWTNGARLVTGDGTPIDSATTRFGELVTVFPDGHVGVDDSQVVLLRVDPGLLSDRTVAHGAVDGWVAYSKICTHAGCSVGLFGIDDREPDTVRQLVCPCHQSIFDPVDGARPVGGPATRSLPQLALAVDGDGFLVAQGDFDTLVGPIAWTEG